MTNLGLKAELRNAETIRAYLDELVRLKTPVQLWMAHSDAIAFETTLERCTASTFSTTTTPLLETGQVLNLSFMLDTRRFITYTKVMATGVFSIPLSIAQGERRDRLRATFDRNDGAEVFAVEHLNGTVASGRAVLGKLLDLSLQGLRVALDDTAILSGEGLPLRRGDTFAAICINNLPHTPTIHCSGVVAHIIRTSPKGLSAGFLLSGVADGDQRNIDRILARRFPATFGQAFPNKKRKTDIADQVGTPTATQVKSKAPEVVAVSLEVVAPPAPRPQRPPLTAVMRLRKLGKKILFLSANLEATPILAEAFRQDGFKNVFEARSFLDAQNLAKKMHFDLLLLDVKVGGHWGKDMMGALRSHQLLVDTPIILVAEHRNEGSGDVADALQAVHVHERGETYDDLLPLLHRLLLD